MGDELTCSIRSEAPVLPSPLLELALWRKGIKSMQHPDRSLQARGPAPPLSPGPGAWSWLSHLCPLKAHLSVSAVALIIGNVKGHSREKAECSQDASRLALVAKARGGIIILGNGVVPRRNAGIGVRNT